MTGEESVLLGPKGLRSICSELLTKSLLIRSSFPVPIYFPESAAHATPTPTKIQNNIAFDRICKLKSVKLCRRIEKIAPMAASSTPPRSGEPVLKKLRTDWIRKPHKNTQNATAGTMPHSAAVSK